MNASVSDLATWSRTRWWTAIFIALVVQVLLIYLLSDRQPIVPRRASSSPAYYLLLDAPPTAAVGELLNLGDPSLFALPSLRGFSGEAWLRPHPLVHQSEDWNDSPRWLTLNVAELGAAFNAFARTNGRAQRTFSDKPSPRLTKVNPPPIPLPTNSSFRIEGELAGRELLTPVEIPSFPHTDVLRNTVVQLVVNASGYAFPPVVLGSSGSKAADQEALKLAKSMRFKPLGRAHGGAPRSATSLTWGKAVFEWHTLELLPTNSPTAIPPP